LLHHSTKDLRLAHKLKRALDSHCAGQEEKKRTAHFSKKLKQTDQSVAERLSILPRSTEDMAFATATTAFVKHTSFRAFTELAFAFYLNSHMLPPSILRSSGLYLQGAPQGLLALSRSQRKGSHLSNVVQRPFGQQRPQPHPVLFAHQFSALVLRQRTQPG
jgi:hypothetical protein